MIGRSNFLKKAESKKTSIALDLGKFKKERSNSQSDKKVQLKRADISKFRYIGIFDKKVIVAFHNQLQIFAYFDFHAIHERIRYEYYSWKIKKMEGISKKECVFDEWAIEKQGKATKSIYQDPKKILLLMKSDCHSLFRKG